MGFKISGNLGDGKPIFKINYTDPGADQVEVVIDEKRIQREQASRILHMMGNRILECDWPPDENCSRPAA
jgi:polyisoprenoid-binding protein YceI